ncbi:ABC transporter permease [Bosea sp. 2KB_26]|uniref:ABC transporter permease n=1 Tax=Bosea sp. 2KB_26 TaxID=3237475 RepID=UPI003F8ED082
MLTASASATQIRHYQRLWLYGLCALIFTFLIVPCVLIVPMSFSASNYLEFPPRAWSLRWYQEFFESREWMDALWLSLKVAGLTTLIATPIGTAAAYGLARMPERLTKSLRMSFLLPMIVPNILVAIGVFFVFARLGLNNTLTGLVLVDVMLALPFVLVTVSSGLQSFDENQERAARSLGATRFRAFLTVTVPQIRSSIAAGALFAFVTAFDEVVIALYISSGENSTLPRRMFANIRDQVDPLVAAVSSVLVVASIAILIAVQLINRPAKAVAR